MLPRPSILVPHRASLAPACVFCGRPVKRRVTMTFSDGSGNAVMFFGLLGRLLTSRRVAIRAGVCARHRAAQRRWTTIGLVFAVMTGLAVAAAIWAGSREPPDERAANAYGVTALVTLIGAAVSFILVPRLRSLGVTASHVELGGVHPLAIPTDDGPAASSPPVSP